MKPYLSIDTATGKGSVAVGVPGRVSATVGIYQRRHSGALLAAVDYLLSVEEVAYRDLAGVVLGDGPGSFTGLRIGFASAKGLVADHDIPVLLAPSMMAAAWSARRVWGGPIRVAYDALRGEVYGAEYSFSAERVVEELKPTLFRAGTGWKAGSSAPKGLVVEEPLLGVDWLAEGSVPRTGLGSLQGGAASLIELLDLRDSVTSVTDVSGLEPNYGRKAEAQVRWEAKHGVPLPHQAGITGRS